MKSAPILLEIELKLTSSRSPWRHPIQAWRDRRSLKRIRRSVEAELETNHNLTSIAPTVPPTDPGKPTR